MKRRTFLFPTGAAILVRPLSAQSCGLQICRSEANWQVRLNGLSLTFVPAA